jgi:CheY-like chemotaxis protein
MDLALPELDGWATLQQMRADPRTRDLPVVAITAYHSGKVANDALEAGFNAYFSKPLDPSTFVDRLTSIVSAS